MSPQKSTPPIPPPPGEGLASQALPGQGKRKHAGPDLQALAERVLQMIKEEARLERERLGQRR